MARTLRLRTDHKGRARRRRPPVSIIGTTVDVRGQLWHVHERRPTRHGFFVELGWPDGQVPGPDIRSGRASVISTPMLAAYLCATPDFRAVDLPLCDAKISHLRMAIGMDRHSQNYNWWQAREADIHRLSVRDFSRRHSVSLTSIYTYFDAREQRYGRKNRPAGWWQAPDIAEQLLTLPGQEAAQRFDIKVATVYEYKRKLRKKAVTPSSDGDD